MRDSWAAIFFDDCRRPQTENPLRELVRLGSVGSKNTYDAFGYANCKK